MTDEFSPGGNPQDRFTIVKPEEYLPPRFVPAQIDAQDAQVTIDAIEADMRAAAASGQLNQVLDIALGVLRAVLGVAKV